MLKNIAIIFISMIYIVSCDTASQSNSATSPLENGKILLAEANKARAEGDLKAAKKNYQKAIRELENAVKEDAGQEGLASLLGESQYRVRDFDNAIKWLKKAVAQDQTDLKSTQFLGYCFLNKTLILEAKQTLNKAILLDPSGSVKEEIIEELISLGELNLSIGDNFDSQSNPTQGFEFKKLGMRILAMALDISKYDMTLAKKIEVHANEVGDEVLIAWIKNIIEKDGKNIITIKQ